MLLWVDLTVTIPQEQDVQEGYFSINFLFVSEENVSEQV